MPPKTTPEVQDVQGLVQWEDLQLLVLVVLNPQINPRRLSDRRDTVREPHAVLRLEANTL